MAHPTIRAERRERKKRKRMPVSGKHVFALQQLMAKPRTSVRRSARTRRKRS